MKRYLLDTNVCVFYLRGKYAVADYIKRVGGFAHCCISEITVAELKYGDAYARKKGVNYKNQSLDAFFDEIEILPITDAIDLYASEKARMKWEGTPSGSDFDLLIGCTAVQHNCICVTENTKDFQNIKHIKLENWIQRN